MAFHGYFHTGPAIITFPYSTLRESNATKTAKQGGEGKAQWTYKRMGNWQSAGKCKRKERRYEREQTRDMNVIRLIREIGAAAINETK